jgi:hypothetical protein
MNIAQQTSKDIIDTDASNHNNAFSSLKIIRQLYDCDRDNMLFTLKDNEDNTFVKAAYEIVLNKEMIAALPADDILLIAYVAGIEHSNDSLPH